MGGFWVLGGQNQFFRNFERARAVSEISVASESRKNTEFYENRCAVETALSFSMFKRARGVKKIYFGKTRLEDLRKKTLW